MSGEDVREDDGEESGESGTADVDCAGGSPAIRMPRESPSKSWWNMIAVTRDTNDNVSGGREDERA